MDDDYKYDLWKLDARRAQRRASLWYKIANGGALREGVLDAVRIDAQRDAAKFSDQARRIVRLGPLS